ncbi:hypothetical protein PV963_07135 [Streptomyces coeruleorubidus]|uniref:hypothetical protein n=1 Tax=Streptomyces coeruleorubidus TaxID=116188 RepID=UPI00237F8AA0|nr:hypothetical protein [Streptomyces coeruleorubidus]WDV50155.1 hypothetical protein PV963_07135 [Streptomyces coeruleorubidus]
MTDTVPRFSRRSAPRLEEYTEGIHVGHRWYDAEDVRPLFPFGHGPSYTSFAYAEPDARWTAAGRTSPSRSATPARATAWTCPRCTRAPPRTSRSTSRSACWPGTGSRTLWIGASSRDPRLRTSVRVGG